MKFLRRVILVIILGGFFFLPNGLYSQSWQTLNASTLGWRFEDMQFVDAETGWVVDGGGQILKTSKNGLGVFASDKIKNNVALCLYLGNIVLRSN